MAEFTIDVQAGKLRVEEWMDKTYPGITIYKNEDQLVIVECKTQDFPNEFFAYVWRDDAGDPDFSVSYLDVPAGSVSGADMSVATTAGLIDVVKQKTGVEVYANGKLLVKVEWPGIFTRTEITNPKTGEVEYWLEL